MIEATVGKSVQSTALLLFLGLVIANFALQPLTEPDFGWHLRTGLDLLHEGLVLPSSDPYSHTMSDWAWVEHAWLTDVIIGAVYTYGGGWGVILLFGGVTACAWLLAVSLADCGWLYRLLACSLSLWVALPYLGARTQLVSLLGLAVLSNILWRWWEKSWIWGIPFLFLLWANLHGGFTVGLFLLGLVIAASLVGQWVQVRWPFLGATLLPSDSPKQLLLITVVSALITFVNPYGWRLHAEIIDSLSNQFMLEALHEWQSPSLSTVAGRSYMLYLGGLGLATLVWYRRVEPVRWTILAVFLALSLRHMRNIPVFLIVSLPLCAELLAKGIDQLAGWASPDAVMTRRWMLTWTVAAGLFLFWLGPGHLHHVVLSGLRPAQYFRGTSYPIEAVEWIQSHRDRVGQRLYNDYAYGGFLLWWLPGEKIFIDGRMPAWHLGERRIFQDYVALAESDPPSDESAWGGVGR
jgi:hypothetical protein